MRTKKKHIIDRLLYSSVLLLALQFSFGTINAQNPTGVHVGGNIYGGGNEADVKGNVTVSINQPLANVGNDVYGGGALAHVNVTTENNVSSHTPNTTTSVTIANGTVSGNVYGGGLGQKNGLNGATSDIAALVYGPVEVTISGGGVSGSVYGCNNVNGAPQNTVDVTVDGGTITQNVFGGGNLAAYSGSPIVTINGGTVTQSVFGGGNLAIVEGNTSVTVNGGRIVEDVYGGGALADVGTNASSNTTIVDILGGTIERGVYGGGLGDADNEPAVNAVVTVNIGKLNPENPNDTIGTATLVGASVYGGNNAKGSPQDNVYVNIWKTAHTEKDKASYLGNDRTYAIANVFGGGNESDYDPADGKQSVLHVYGCYNTVQRTFGGGNAAATPSVTSILDGGRFSQVFGGGNGEVTPADVNGAIDLQIHGGNVGQFYGGSNTSGSISDGISVVVDDDGPCGDLVIDEFFCGGNFADITGDLETSLHCGEGNMLINNLYGGCNQADITGNVVLNVYGGIYTNVYGGSKGRLRETNGPEDQGKSADIGGNVTLNLYGGTIENAFGGSNVRGNITGTITVNVLDIEEDCPLYITNIYGGSNLASYEPTNPNAISPVVNVAHAKYGIRGNVYGGGKGLPGMDADVKSNPRVNIGYDPDMDSYIPQSYKNTYMNYLDPNNEDPTRPSAIVAGSVFGGGDAAKVIGNTAIFLRNRAKVFGNVYGGGNMGEVTGDTKVIVNGANQ